MSLNDPHWGNRGQEEVKKEDAQASQEKPKQEPPQNQTPPDLDEVWRDFNRRLSGMFDKKKPVNHRGVFTGGGGSNGNGSPKKREMGPYFLSKGVSLLLAVVIVAWLSSGFYIVDAPQRGIVLEFGRYKTSTDPGLQWRLPYPIQSHELVNVSNVRTVEVGYRGSEQNKVLKESLMLTDDENIINIQFAVQYILKDPKDYIFNNRNADESVVHAAETAVREIVGKSKMDYVLYEGREDIAARASALMQAILDRYKTGILISRVSMQNAQPPEKVQAAFDDAVKASQDRERQKNEGQAYANDVVPKASGAASRLLQEAEGYKQRIIVSAEGDASRFKQVYAEYAKAPEVTRTRMYLDAMQQIYSSTSKVLLDTKGQGLLYLPLDKLIAQNGVPAAANTQESSEPAPLLVPVPAATQNNTERTRDNLRSRERSR